MISIYTVDSFQDENKFQIFKLFTESLRNKDKVKRTGMMRITSLEHASSEGTYWIAKPNLEELSLIFRRFFENS